MLEYWSIQNIRCLKFWWKYCKYCFDCFLLAGGNKVGSLADAEVTRVWCGSLADSLLQLSQKVWRYWPDTSFWYRKLTLILILFNKVKNKGSNEYPTPYLFNSPLYIFLVFFTSLMKLYTLKLHNLNTHYTVNTSYIMCIIISPSQLLCREVKREYCFNINLLVVQNFILLSYM